MTIEVAAPPAVAQPASTAWWSRLMPVAIAVLMTGMAAALYRSGSATPRNPMLVAFPVMMLGSACVTVISGRRTDLDADRRGYLDYLSGLRRSVTATAAAQRASLINDHPDPEALWTGVGSRCDTGSQCGRVRVGVGAAPLDTVLVAPPMAPQERADPVTATAVRRFIQAHAELTDVPVTIALGAPVTVDGDPAAVRGLLRAMVCQLALRYSPDQLCVIAVLDSAAAEQWEWLKWLPHHQYPVAADSSGSDLLRYPTLRCAQDALTGLQPPHAVIVIDGDVVDGKPVLSGDVTILEVGTRCERFATPGPRLIMSAGELRQRDGVVLARPDRLSQVEALVFARRLAGHGRGRNREHPARWADLAGIGDPAQFDPVAVWHRRNDRDRLRAIIGTTAAGAPVGLDIKEAAEGGTGPHGLCVGATGSGKSELLRTIVLGMLARHAPDELNLVLIDFKGGATFLGLEGIRHVAAVITNLADEEPLVARMHDALVGEMTRRQELLRAAGCVSVAGYRDARRAGTAAVPLPALFIIVDEFSELLSQHPDFVDMFVAIGRLGRSLGMHLLLASQRVDEGRLRGLDSHLSYRICLKTLSAGESRIVLGSSDAYELPASPGAGYLRSATGEVIRFQAAYVSGPAAAAVDPRPQLFSADPRGRRAASAPAETATVLQTVVGRLAGHGTPARQVWLPPLGQAPELGTLLGAPNSAAVLRVPIGVVDRPLEQRRTPLLIDLSAAAGNVAVVGGPQAGKSTALCTVITALAATHTPRQVQFYCLDFGGGALAALAALPHVGAVVEMTQPDLVSRTLAELETLITRRESRFRMLGISSMADYRRLLANRDPRCAGEQFGDVFLVIDGWARLRHDFDLLEASITALAGHALSFGVHVALSAGRWADLRPALKDQIGTRIELRLGDPADSEVNRRRAQHVPIGIPGRGLTEDGLHMLIAAPFDAFADVAQRRGDGHHAPPVRMLPEGVEQSSVLRVADADLRTRVLVGLGERELKPAAIDFDRQPHLLVFGDTGSGKTSVLRTLCAEITRTAEAAQVVVVDYRRTLLGVIGDEQRGGYAASAAALTELLPGLLGVLRQRMPGPQVSPQQLRARSWWSGPEIYLVIDDYDVVVAGGEQQLAAIVEFLPYAGDLGLHVVIARRTGGAARAMFEPLLAGLRDMGAMGLILSGSPEDGPLIGAVRPTAQPPGRGTLITRAGAQHIQVGWSPPP